MTYNKRAAAQKRSDVRRTLIALVGLFVAFLGWVKRLLLPMTQKKALRLVIVFLVMLFGIPTVLTLGTKVYYIRTAPAQCVDNRAPLERARQNSHERLHGADKDYKPLSVDPCQKQVK